jgi:hypothetical protein
VPALQPDFCASRKAPAKLELEASMPAAKTWTRPSASVGMSATAPMSVPGSHEPTSGARRVVVRPRSPVPGRRLLAVDQHAPAHVVGADRELGGREHHFLRHGFDAPAARTSGALAAARYDDADAACARRGLERFADLRHRTDDRVAVGALEQHVVGLQRPHCKRVLRRIGLRRSRGGIVLDAADGVDARAQRAARRAGRSRLP